MLSNMKEVIGNLAIGIIIIVFFAIMVYLGKKIYKVQTEPIKIEPKKTMPAKQPEAPWWVLKFDAYSPAPVALGVLVAAIIFLYQGYSWLQNGYWSPLPLVTLFASHEFITEYSSWYNTPDSWIGLNKVIRWIFEKIPLSFATIGAGFFVKFMWESSVREYWEKNPRKLSDE